VSLLTRTDVSALIMLTYCVHAHKTT